MRSTSLSRRTTETTYTVTYSVSGSLHATASVTFTAVVAAATAPPPDPPPADRAEVSVELTGMTADFDCTVAGNPCTNNAGTLDDSWSGTLGAGDHKIE